MKDVFPALVARFDADAVLSAPAMGRKLYIRGTGDPSKNVLPFVDVEASEPDDEFDTFTSDVDNYTITFRMFTKNKAQPEKCYNLMREFRRVFDIANLTSSEFSTISMEPEGGGNAPQLQDYGYMGSVNYTLIVQRNALLPSSRGS